MLKAEFAKIRQTRLLDVMQRLKLDAVAIGSKKHVYYFTAHWTQSLHQSGFVLFSDGRSALITANQPSKTAAADDIQSYEAQWMATQRSEQAAVVGEKLRDVLNVRGATRIAVD